MQVALVVAADEILILGEGHVAFQDTGTHARASLMALLGGRGELQRPTPAVAEGEVSLEKVLAIRTLLEVALEFTEGHFVDEIERSWAKLDVRALVCGRIVLSEAIGCHAYR